MKKIHKDRQPTTYKEALTYILAAQDANLWNNLGFERRTKVQKMRPKKKMCLGESM